MPRNPFTRKKGLSDYSYDELLNERSRLEAAEQKTLRDLQKLEQEKNGLFDQAKVAASVAVRQVKARQIRDLNHRIDGLQGNIRRLGKVIQIVDLSMSQMEQDRLSGEGSTLMKIIGSTDSLDLQEWVDKVVSGEAVTEQKVDELLKAFGDAEDLRGRVSTGDAEVDSIMAEIERAAATEAMTRELGLAADEQPGREPRAS